MPLVATRGPSPPYHRAGSHRGQTLVLTSDGSPQPAARPPNEKASRQVLKELISRVVDPLAERAHRRLVIFTFDVIEGLFLGICLPAFSSPLLFVAYALISILLRTIVIFRWIQHIVTDYDAARQR